MNQTKPSPIATSSRMEPRNTPSFESSMTMERKDKASKISPLDGTIRLTDEIIDPEELFDWIPEEAPKIQ